jgi:hypothetical protein
MTKRRWKPGEFQALAKASLGAVREMLEVTERANGLSPDQAFDVERIKTFRVKLAHLFEQVEAGSNADTESLKLLRESFALAADLRTWRKELRRA